MNKDTQTRKRSKKIGIGGLSTLEADIMSIIWQSKKITVRDVHEIMLEDGYIPYTTVMATMNNMALKGILKQYKDGKAYIYSAAITRDAMATKIVDATIKRVLGGDATPIVLYLLGLKEAEDLEKLLALMKG